MRFVVALVIVTLSAPAAWACSCAAGWTPERAFTAADVVFLGTATPPEPYELWIAPYKRLRATTFEVEAMFKDSYAWREGEPIRISIADREDSCATSFEPGRRYLVYAWRTEGQLPQTSYCAGNEIVTDTSDALTRVRIAATTWARPDHPPSPDSLQVEEEVKPASVLTAIGSRLLLGSVVLNALLGIALAFVWSRRDARAGNPRNQVNVK